MQENKYYTPDIEDIRVGYEGEINWSRAYTNDFTPFKITVQNEDFAYHGQISEITDAMDDGYGEVRTKYLTKEDVEREGWKQSISKGRLYKENKWGYIQADLDILPNNSVLISKNGSVVFCGECKSINELRTIQKLLNIK